MMVAFVLASAGFITTLGFAGEARQVYNFDWFQLGGTTLRLGWILDPLTACMLVMVTFVGLLIFIYSTGYMAHDENFTRFFCFLSLFAAAMLGLVLANNLLLLFICWELVGLASYLLIGFWYHKPSAAAAAKKAFITTRIGDMGFFLGVLWLYSEAGTLLFYENGIGCLEPATLAKLAAQTSALGMAVSTGIALLIFCGAVGKSGQVPLHVWLPDAMEGPTPVSALIHAATMVAAGVFLIARVYPLMEASPPPVAALTAPVNSAAVAAPQTDTADATHQSASSTGSGGSHQSSTSAVLKVVTWTGAITAVFAALIAVAQTDIKRILAYSTVSQLGYMMMGLGVGGVAVGMFHLITHAFFKALLFLGAGSVIHGCHEEQDIRRMGGLRGFMPITFATYAIGMMALSGVPFVFSGFWSKDEILHSALHWNVSRWPFFLGLLGALLTAFYMTRQMYYVFFGQSRLLERGPAVDVDGPDTGHASVHLDKHPHESPPAMTLPLGTLAVFTVLLSALGTPAWPWFQAYLEGRPAELHLSKLFEPQTLGVMCLSIAVVTVGIGLGWWLYGRRPIGSTENDPLEVLQPKVYPVLANKFFVDELYGLSVVRLNAWWSRVCDWLDRTVWDGLVQVVSYGILGLSWLNRFFDEFLINLGFNRVCGELRRGSSSLARLQDGQVHHYLRVLGVALVVLVLLLSWGCQA
jgi:NADH-quinone oxidoreductase subunit L